MLARHTLRHLQRLGWSVCAVALLAVATARAEPSEPAGEAGEVGPRHRLGLFAGVTFKEHEGGSATLGADYLYRLGRPVSVGGVLETTGKDSRDWILAALGVWHPSERWRVFGGLGIEVAQDDRDSEFLFRVGADYDFELTRHWAIAPTLALDFTESENAIVIGVTFGRGF